MTSQPQQLCERCWLESRSKFNTGTRKNWKAPKEILERQQFKCVYTGELLTIGVNATLDHILPRALGGNGELSNLQWVDKKINRMKTDMSHAEFIETVRIIAARHALKGAGNSANQQKCPDNSGQYQLD